MFPQLETERLRLRELTVNDAERVLACFSNELVIRYYGQDKMTRVEEARISFISSLETSMRKEV